MSNIHNEDEFLFQEEESSTDERKLKFVSGKVDIIKSKELGRIIFKPYTIHHFVTQLNLLINRSLLEVEKQIHKEKYIKDYTGFDKPTIPSYVKKTVLMNHFQCEINKGTNDKPYMVTAHPYVKALNLDRKNEEHQPWSSFKDMISSFKVTDVRTDSLSQVMDKLRDVGFINAYSDGNPMFRYFCNQKKHPLYDPSCGEDHIIISSNINKGNRSKKSPSSGGTDDKVNMQNVDTYFKAFNFDEWSMNKDTVELQGVLNVHGLLVPHLDEEKCETTLRNTRLSSDKEFKYVYLLSPAHSLAESIFDRMLNMTKYKDTDIEIYLLNNTVEACLRDRQLPNSCYNRTFKDLSRLRFTPMPTMKDPKTWEDILANTSDMYQKSLSNHKYRGSHRFNLLDSTFIDKAFGDSYSVKGLDVKFYRFIRQKYGINFRMISEDLMDKGVFGISGIAWENYIKEHVLTDVSFTYMLSDNQELQMKNSVALDSQMFIPFDFSLTKALFSSKNLLNNIQFRQKYGRTEIEGFDKKFKSQYEIVPFNKNNALDSVDFEQIFSSIKKDNQRESIQSSQAFRLFMENYDVDKNGLKFKRNLRYIATEDSQYGKINNFELNLLTGLIERDLPEFITADGVDYDTSNCKTFDDFKEIITADIYAQMTSFESDCFSRLCEGMGGSALIYYKLNREEVRQVRNSTEKLSLHPSEFSNDLIAILQELEINKDTIVFNVDSGDKLLLSYQCHCPECNDGHMIPEDAYEEINMIAKNHDNLSLKNVTRLNEMTETLVCTACGHILENSKRGFLQNKYSANFDKNALIKQHFLGTSKKNYTRFDITGYQWDEGILNLYVEYYYSLDNPRFSGSCKTVANGVNQKLVGRIPELVIPHPTDDSLTQRFEDIHLDIQMNQNAFKFGIAGIVQDYIRLVNAVHGTKYNIRNYVNSETLDLDLKELNDRILSKLKKTSVSIDLFKYEDSIRTESFLYGETMVEAYIVMTSVMGTEISQENNKVSSIQSPTRIPKQDSGLFRNLHFDKLVELLYSEVSISSFEDESTRENVRELLSIYQLLVTPISQDVNKTDQDLRLTWKMLSSATKPEDSLDTILLKTKNKKLVFNQESKNRVNLTSLMPISEYQKLVNHHPLLRPTSPTTDELFANNAVVTNEEIERAKLFENGNYITVEMQDGKQGIKKYRIKFPSRRLLMSLVDKNFNGYKVRLDKAFVHFLKLYEDFCTSEFDNTFNTLYFTRDSKNKGKDRIRYASIISKLRDSILEILLGKKGKFDNALSINSLCVQGKQVTGRIPYGEAVIGDNKIWNKLTRNYLKMIYPDGEHPIYGNIEEIFLKNNLPDFIKELTPICFAHRNPAAFDKQALSFVKVRHIESMGKKFNETYPLFNGIMLNELMVVRELESDFDGDSVFLFVLASKNSNSEIEAHAKELHDHITSDINGYYKNYQDTEDPDAVLVNSKLVLKSEVYNYEAKKLLSYYGRQSTFRYLMDESEKVFKAFPDSIRFDLHKAIIPREYKNFAIEEARESKSDVAYLTPSSWKLDDALEYLLYHKYAHNVDNILLDEKSRFKLLFVFRYILLQLNGTRGIKKTGEYSKITFDKYMSDEKIRKVTNWNEIEMVSARDSFRLMLEEYDEENGTDTVEVIDILESIRDYFMVDKNGEFFTDPNSGRIYNVIGKAEKKDSANGISRIDKSYRDIVAMYIIVNGRSFEGFVKTFGYQTLFKGILSPTHLNSTTNAYDGLKRLSHYCLSLKNLFKK